MTSAQSTRNTSIRTRKIRGDDSLVRSISIAAREEAFWGIGRRHPWRKSRGRAANMAQERREKRPLPLDLSPTKGNRILKPGIIVPRILPMFDVRGEMSGFSMTLTYLAALVLIAVSLSILMAGAWLVQQRTGNSGWVDTIWTFSLGLVGAMSALWPVAGPPNARQWLVAALVAVWSLRLGIHIAIRTAGITDDPRYACFAK